MWPPAPAVPAAGCSATPAQVEANKKVAMEFFRDGITPPERIALVDPNYVQHNPAFHRYALENKVSDYETLKVMATRAGAQRTGPAPGAQGPQPPAPNMFERVIGACDVVTMIHKLYAQDPTAPAGAFYERFTFDTFRVRNGKLVEHWDGTTLPAPQPAAPASTRAN
jgi:predicted SnoaL-like aldol condensation-catalyzing enzyme